MAPTAASGAAPAVASPAAISDPALEAWRRRAVLVGGGFQVVFGALWLARAVAVLVPLPAAMAAGGLVLLGGIGPAVALRHAAPRPTGPEAARIERRVTFATAIQILASAVLPLALGGVGDGRLASPSVVLTIGALLAWLRNELGTPYHGPAGLALVAVAVASASLTGSAQALALGAAAAAILLGCAAAGFCWLRAADH